MKLVYQLSEELKSNFERVSVTQALTLDDSRPLIGLTGSLGLFGSREWWDNIKQGVMPLLRISGIVLRAYCAGQDPSEENNMVDLQLADGSVRAVGIYVNDEIDIGLFKLGHKVEIVYALDELKRQPAVDGGVNYSKIALEMAVSLIPII
ncbi:hypothetical protein [Duganella sp. Root1480D1]|uniref:hypothetical protein n=1 Tax=Duganella sp. Root1480D1 TaxID=1736471 RepID=UPI00070A6DBD|nr:hypothetical protein [Duganella sp. Root1480D1]KQZ27066.1 hypothetical protein ASD58_15970 [Duganella sp. Root1480D1]